MKIALIGYGKMGKAIESIALQRGHEIVARINSQNPIEQLDYDDVDVAIEFTAPHFAVTHIEHCLKNATPVIVGTTAWNEQLDFVKELVVQHSGSLLYSSNFSIGVNIFFEINRQLARFISDYPEYIASIEETHHTEKLDSPSGTAVSLANDVMLENSQISSWIHSDEVPAKQTHNQLGVTSYRRKDVPGTHVVKYDSGIDSIEIKHIAHNRKGFALGAVIAAEWIIDKKGVFTMKDIINI